MKYHIFFFCLLAATLSHSQTIVRDIKSFGAKGDGKTNDHDAFEKAAAFFTQRGGNGKLVLSKGIYIVGKQTATGGKNNLAGYHGADVMHFSGVRNFTIEGQPGTTIKYKAGLRYGAFDPVTGKPHQHNGYFVNWAYAAMIGHCIVLDKSENVKIISLELDGNNTSVVLGGTYGDVGRQLPHYGIFIQDSRSVTVQNVNLHHFALDGICVANHPSTQKNNIELLDSRFEYNSRQGFSWVGGNELRVKNCKFNHTGQSHFGSPPGAGVDIEAEYGPIRNGIFENCEFINNKGAAVVADSGDSGNCTFKNCTFWGTEYWSVWINKPGFTFIGCNIYGSMVHGFNASNDKEATKFIQCRFEDKLYNGKEPYGSYLIETNGMRRVSFDRCTFVSNRKKLMWVFAPAEWKPEEKYQFNNCRFVINNNNLGQGDFVAVIRGMRYKNSTFEFKSKDAKKKGYWLNDCCEKYNVDEGGNKIIFQ